MRFTAKSTFFPCLPIADITTLHTVCAADILYLAFDCRKSQRKSIVKMCNHFSDLTHYFMYPIDLLNRVFGTSIATRFYTVGYSGSHVPNNPKICEPRRHSRGFTGVCDRLTELWMAHSVDIVRGAENVTRWHTHRDKPLTSAAWCRRYSKLFIYGLTAATYKKSTPWPRRMRYVNVCVWRNGATEPQGYHTLYTTDKPPSCILKKAAAFCIAKFTVHLELNYIGVISSLYEGC